MIKTLINPFDNLTDNQLFFLGFAGYFVHSIFSNQWNYIADGIIQLHQISSMPLGYSLVNNAINTLVLTLVLFIYGKIIFSKTRFIDVLNVVWFAQLTQVFLAIILFNPFVQKHTAHIQIAIENHDFQLKTVPKYELVLMGGMGILALFGIFYFFYLLVTGMKIAMNIKKKTFTILLIVITLLVDAVLKFSYPYIL
ncbi:YIP1 family protein [Sphingobacterium sp. HJSM2_6]|uniref:YIP1 family protein n=1 Tax=Sphingobacterium sp. HJSM2_6 TaxID=3366264 RepID=UPI003BBDB9AF